ncbi:hypothetical protein [Enterobacter mori]|uniref:hypothetical protein n=1 Tax=Enterobacter mori TaxID=539813 RepID=UPI001B8AF3FD|nr:hypothetical protein [Enterobacter mori]MBS3050410.1 hypothetical protein [Enterobacter mori]
MLNNILTLTERRLEGIRKELLTLRETQSVLEKQMRDALARIEVLDIQSQLFEQAAELSRQAFDERQRQKAGVLAEIARLKYQHDSLHGEKTKLEASLHRVQARLRQTNNRCEKFRSYLKQQRGRQRLKSELRQQEEIEELSIYGGDKLGT